MDSDLSDHEEGYQDDVFINTEHVSQTEELIEERTALTEDLNKFCDFIRQNVNIETLVLEEDNSKKVNLQTTVVQLKSLVEGLLKSRQKEDEKEQCTKEKEEDFKTDLICIEDINDEHLKLEAKLHNAETVLEKYKIKFDEQTNILKAKETKVTDLSCKLATSEVRLKLAEEQISTLKRDFNRQDAGGHDHYTEAVEARNVAIKEKNEAWIELSQTKGELIQTNQQLIEVINQKVELGQQLEKWQIDMQKILEEQIEMKMRKTSKA